MGPQCWAVDAVICNFGLPRATLQTMSTELKMIYFRQRHSKINSVLALCVSLNTNVLLPSQLQWQVSRGTSVSALDRLISLKNVNVMTRQRWQPWFRYEHKTKIKDEKQHKKWSSWWFCCRDMSRYKQRLQPGCSSLPNVI